MVVSRIHLSEAQAERPNDNTSLHNVIYNSVLSKKKEVKLKT